MILAERLQILADPYAQDRWEPLYDELEQIPPLSESELSLVMQTIKTELRCEYALVRLFCLDLLAANRIPVSRILDELRFVIENGNDAERSVAFQMLRKSSVDAPLVVRALESIDAGRLAFFARWELRRVIKKKRQG